MQPHNRYVPDMLAILMAATLALFASAVPTPASAQPTGSITVPVNGGELVRLSRPAEKVFIADPQIADFQAASAKSILVYGRRAGRTTLYALDGKDQIILSRTIAVEHDVEAISTLLQQELPQAGLTVRSTPAGLVLSGQLATSAEADHAVALASGFLSENEGLINKLQITSPTQVNIRIRVAEMAREVTRQFGFNWQTIGNLQSASLGVFTGRSPLTQVVDDVRQVVGSNALLGTAGGSLFGELRIGDSRVTGLIDALARENLITILAEPNLTALSGETASFIAGGEFPIPVSQDDNTITIEFKKFGVVLDVVPTVLSPNRISLKVRPEVSELTSEGAITLNEISIPAINVRRAETTVELASGQSFAIAGLLQNESRSTVEKFPGLGDLPIIGALFRSERFQRNETELVIIATAYTVAPTGADIPDPLAGFRPVTELERILQGKVAKRSAAAGVPNPVGPGGARLLGDAGFFF